MSKFKVVISHEVYDHSVDILKDSCDVIVASSYDDLIEQLKTAHALLMFGREIRYNEELLRKIEGSPLKIIANMGIGMDHIDVEALKKRGIVASNTSGSLDNSVAEMAVCLALCAGHRVKERSEAIINGDWRKSPKWLCGQDVFGSTFGIIGLGSIGRAIGKKIYSFEPKRILYSGNSPKDYAKEFNAEFVPLDTLLEQSDFVVLACPLNDQTLNLINADKLKIMKRNAIIVNIARGDIIDQNALEKALQDGTIGGAGLDVTVPEPLPSNHSLTRLKNCVLTPHVASATVATRIIMARTAAENIYNALHGMPIPNLVERN